MNNVSFIEIDGKEYAIINRGNEEFTSMPKSTYEAMQAEQSTPIVMEDE
jgi:PHD/YefM family antitoxin component YafN of YafNO toxin-antitoxin module